MIIGFYYAYVFHQSFFIRMKNRKKNSYITDCCAGSVLTKVILCKAIEQWNVVGILRSCRDLSGLKVTKGERY